MENQLSHRWNLQNLSVNSLFKMRVTLEREMICERVRAGMANAKAKGKRIGRIKQRNSLLIRSLIDAKLSYREIARIAKCSHGSVHAEVVAYKKEQQRDMQAKQDKLVAESSISAVNQTTAALKEMNLSEETIMNVQARMEGDARTKVTAIQGQYYETYD
jgi:hypothetical protein